MNELDWLAIAHVAILLLTVGLASLVQSHKSRRRW